MPNVSGCVSRTMKNAGKSEEKKPQKPVQEEPSDQCSSSSLHSESLEYLLRTEKFDYIRQLVNQDLQRHHEEIAASGKQILKILGSLQDASNSQSRRAFLRDDLLTAVRKHESIMKRLKLKKQWEKTGDSQMTSLSSLPEKVNLEYSYEPPDYVKKPEFDMTADIQRKTLESVQQSVESDRTTISENLPLEMVEN